MAGVVKEQLHTQLSFLFSNVQQAETSDYVTTCILALSHILHHRGRGTELLDVCRFMLLQLLSVGLKVKRLDVQKPHLCATSGRKKKLNKYLLKIKNTLMA